MNYHWMVLYKILFCERLQIEDDWHIVANTTTGLFYLNRNLPSI
jgi:hypothetical protein